MSTSTTIPRPSAPVIDTRTIRIAGRLLEGAKLRPKPPATREQVTRALAKVLAVTSPHGEHGRLLAAALAPRPADQTGPRPPAEWVVRRLLRHGVTPTERAVAASLADHERISQRRTRTAPWRARVAELAAADADRAVALVAERWATEGHGPTWRELGRALGWPSGQVDGIVRALVAARHLEASPEPRSLRLASHAQGGAL